MRSRLLWLVVVVAGLAVGTNALWPRAVSIADPDGPPPMELVSGIPAHLRITQKKLPDNENALHMLTKAVTSAPPVPAAEAQLLSWVGSPRTLTMGERRRVLLAVGPRLPLYREAKRIVDKHRFAWPPSTDPWNAAMSHSLSAPVRDLIGELSQVALLHAEDGRIDDAIDEGVLCLKLSLALARGAGCGTNLMSGGVYLLVGQNCVRHLAEDPKATASHVATLLRAVPTATGKDALLRAIKTDLRAATAFIERCTLDEAYGYLTSAPQDTRPGVTYPHPNPFDRERTFDLLAEATEEALSDVEAGWSPRRRLRVFEDAEADLPVTSSWWESSLPGMVDDHYANEHPLKDKRTWRQFWSDVKDIDNPVGRMLAPNLIWYSPVARDFQVRYDMDTVATRAVCALRLFKLRHGKYPNQLRELVDRGILKDVPLDPASGKPLLYDRAKKRLWSVGLNGIDDGGIGGTTAYTAKDNVYNLP